MNTEAVTVSDGLRVWVGVTIGSLYVSKKLHYCSYKQFCSTVVVHEIICSVASGIMFRAPICHISEEVTAIHVQLFFSTA